jgi:hypothetical protein
VGVVNRDASVALVVGLIVLVVVVVLAAGALGTTRTTMTAGAGVPITMPPDDGSAGTVFGLNERPGQSIFGISLTSSSYHAMIGMVVPVECIRVDESGNETLLSDGVCAGLPVYGVLSGGGTTPSGGRLAIVDIEVSKQCYAALTIGDTWPANTDACGN